MGMMGSVGDGQERVRVDPVGYAHAGLLALEVVGHRVDAAPDAAQPGLMLRVRELLEGVYDARQSVGGEGEVEVVAAGDKRQHPRTRSRERAVAGDVGGERGRG